MVRSNELGCRNGWNADLWVPAATDESQTQQPQPHDAIASRAKAEVVPAEQNDLITSIVAAKTDNVKVTGERLISPPQLRSTLEEDIFVKQTPSLSWSNGPITSQPATELVQDPKSAILRARDQFRERRRNEGRLADRKLVPPAAPMLASEREALRVDAFDLAEPDPAPESIDPRYENRALLPPARPNAWESQRPVAPVARQEIDRPFPSLTEFPEDRVRFESVPAVDQFDDDQLIIETEPDDMWIETRQIDTVAPEPYVVDELFEEEEVDAYAGAEPYVEEEELSVRHRESALNKFFRQRKERRERASQTAEPVFEESYVDQTRHLAAESWVSHPVRESNERFSDMPESDPAPTRAATNGFRTEPQVPASELRSFPSNRDDHGQQSVTNQQRSAMQRSARPEPDFEDDFQLPPPLPVLDSSVRIEMRAERQAYRPNSRQTAVDHTDLRHDQGVQPIADEFGDQPLFASNPTPPMEDYELDRPSSSQPSKAAPSFRLERICQTCRDFRPIENGERGWCNNQWAFNHRRVVDADDLACRNSLGSWWTPKDDVWRRDGDISRHAQQTPRVDQWLFGSHSDENERRRSGS